MKLGFIIPHYHGEKRVALLPEDIKDFQNDIYIETGFAKNMGIDDEEYSKRGCIVVCREDVFKLCDAIFCLKLVQPEDYPFLRKGQMIVGWTHPNGSGKKFFEEIAKPLDLKIVDLDNIFPTLYYQDLRIPIPFIPRDFVQKNSFLAGVASVQDAILRYGIVPSGEKVAVLSNGNVAQGAFYMLSKYNVDVRMFYRKTLYQFYDNISDFDIVVNGIEVDNPNQRIITKQQLGKMKKGCLIIDAAADAGNAIEGTHFSPIDNPIYEEDGLFFYEVNNVPSLIFRTASIEISKAFSKWVYQKDVKQFLDLIQ